MKVILLAVLAIGIAGGVQAQSYPSKPIRAIVNVAAGGVADLTMRMLAPRLTESLGQPVVVENRPGGDGYVGFEAAMRADPDGHSLLYAPGSTIMMAPHLVKRPDIDVLKLFVPIAATGRVSLYLVVHPKFPATTLAEFLAYGRANQGKLSYATPGNGTSPHIATAVFVRESGIKMTHIPYKGAGPALNDLLGGQVDTALDPGTALQSVKAGKLRILAVAGGKRHVDHPSIPTLDEANIRGVDGGPNFGLYGLAATPRLVIDRLNAEVQKAMKDSTVQDRFVALAVEIAEPMSPEGFASYVRGQYERYRKLIPELGINL